MTDPVLQHYDQLAARYDRRWRAYTSATISAIASVLTLDGGERLLDAPCGTGALEEWLKQAHPTVDATGVDGSAAMLAQAAAKHQGAGYTWTQADVHELPFPAGTFDVVVCANSFHCFARPAEVLAEFSRVLKPGGRFLVLDWCDDFMMCKLCGLWLSLVDSAYRRTFTSGACRDLLTEAGFEVRGFQRLRHGLLWGLMLFDCVRGPRAAE